MSRSPFRGLRRRGSIMWTDRSAQRRRRSPRHPVSRTQKCQRRRRHQDQQWLDRLREDLFPPSRRDGFRFLGRGKVSQQRGQIDRRRDDFARHSQSGHPARFTVPFDAGEKRRPGLDRLRFEPVAVAVDQLRLGTEATVECIPAPVRPSRKLAQCRIPVELPRGRVELAQQFVLRINRSDRHASRQPGGDPQIGPVPPAVIHDIPRNPRHFAKAIQRDVRPVFDRQPPQRLQQFFPRGHVPSPSCRSRDSSRVIRRVPLAARPPE